jgi:hypothetical protein
MEHILEPTAQFDFSQFTFVSPTALSGGNYFIRILTSAKQSPVYLQSPKCFTKSGIMKSGKKLLCDLVFQPQDESFLEFLESLESFCQKQIFNNKEKWFEPGLTMLDIENCFASPTKTYKSGKLHSVRCNVPLRMGKCNLKIFNEEEQDVPMDTIKENTSVITIIEIQGIRCSARSFQLEFEIKQMMTLRPSDDIFDKCVFGKTLGKNASNNTYRSPSIISSVSSSSEDLGNNLDAVSTETTIDNSVPLPTNTLVNLEKKVPAISVETVDSEDENAPEKDDHLEIDTEEIPEVDLGEEVPTDEQTVPIRNENPPLTGTNDIQEITFDIPEETGEEMKLKNPHEAYYEMYKEAKRKAQIARDLAISSYLAAKQIKHNYLSDQTFSDDEEMIQEEKELREISLETSTKTPVP